MGQAARIETVVPVVTITCQCRPGNRPLTIAGVSQTTRCLHCGGHWMVMAVTYDRNNGRGIRVVVGKATIDEIAPAPIGAS